MASLLCTVARCLLFPLQNPTKDLSDGRGRRHEGRSWNESSGVLLLAEIRSQSQEVLKGISYGPAPLKDSMITCRSCVSAWA